MGDGIQSEFSWRPAGAGSGDTRTERPPAAGSAGAASGSSPVTGGGRVGDGGQSSEQAEFWKQINFCEFEILPGLQKTVRWGVPDGTRDPADGNLVHDDLLISAALVAALDEQDWTISGPTLIIQNKDPLEDLDKGF